MRTRKYPKVSIIVLSYNRKDDLKECVNSLNSLSYPNYDIIVVDNASTDGSSEEIETYYPHVKLIQNKENLGFAMGNNVGIKYALRKGADYAFLLNDDIVANSNCLGELIDIAHNDPHIGIVGPMIYCYEEQSKIWSAGGKVTWFGKTIEYGKNKLDKGQYSLIKEVDYVTGASMLIKGVVIRKIGLLDPRFFVYYEETDWCLRAKKAGYKVVLVSSARVYHKTLKSRGKGGNIIFSYYMTRNELLFARKHLSLIIFLPIWLVRLAFRICMYAVKAQYQNFRACLKGVFDGLNGKFGKRIIEG